MRGARSYADGLGDRRGDIRLRRSDHRQRRYSPDRDLSDGERYCDRGFGQRLRFGKRLLRRTRHSRYGDRRARHGLPSDEDMDAGERRNGLCAERNRRKGTAPDAYVHHAAERQRCGLYHVPEKRISDPFRRSDHGPGQRKRCRYRGLRRYDRGRRSRFGRNQGDRLGRNRREWRTDGRKTCAGAERRRRGVLSAGRVRRYPDHRQYGARA